MKNRCLWHTNAPFPNTLRIGLTLTFHLLTSILIGVTYSWRTIYLASLNLQGQRVLELSVAQGMEDKNDLWPTDLNINRDHLLIKDYLPTKFEVSVAKRSWVISCTRLRDTDIQTDRPTYQHVQSNMPYFFEEGHNKFHLYSYHNSEITVSVTRLLKLADLKGFLKLARKIQPW